ncbi:hydrogenase maturation protease [Geitlerinema sp. PCC 7407]|uniref:hydrogenase maturation protease n=1 Tax=Geitlerinema sp. PCC 7407 TaxID=1173025 RepID=UPI00029FD757|nr:hydrogenase maturation protease [Geitlerinema sp. PCC 7407]AFY66411.1 hydrogenase maturation protease [Geitlerinema sp. PCC 7407]
MMDYLIIGFGNTLRGDDGVGPQVAEAIAQWQLANVRSRSVHQLTPELAAEIAQAQTVIFVDATVQGETVQWRAIAAGAEAPCTAHYADPRSLLVISQILYGRSPQAYELLIPAVDFSFGETLSETTKNNLKVALEKLKKILGSDLQKA